MATESQKQDPLTKEKAIVIQKSRAVIPSHPRVPLGVAEDAAKFWICLQFACLPEVLLVTILVIIGVANNNF